MLNTFLIIVIVLSIILSAVFSASEIANARSNRLRFDNAAAEGDKIAKIVCYINDHYTRSLSTILAGNNFVNITATSAATVLFFRLFGSRGEAIAGIVITALLLLFGETCPKIIAAAAPDTFARIFAVPVRFFMIIFFPIVWLVEKLLDKLSPMWTPTETAPQVTTDELREILEDIEDEGVFTEDESDLIRSAIDFAETTANEVLTPRVDIVAIDIDDFDPESDLDEELMRHSRIPVYQDTIDNIVGILPTKWLLKEIIEGNDDIDIRDMLVQPLFVHMTCPVSTIIEEFKESHIQMAVVIDEFGGVMGIVTLEDILEEIVGDIYDETDEPEEEEIQKQDDTHFVVDGGMNIYDMFDEVGYEPDPDFETEYTTAGGFAMEVLDKIPDEGDEGDFDNLHLKVLKMDGMRVDSLEVDVLEKAEEED